MGRRALHLYLVFIVMAGVLSGCGLQFSHNVAGQQVIECGFNVTRDGYNFENYGSWAGTPGHCYGVSVTSVLFYLDMKERPGNAETTYDIDREDIGIIIHSYQNTWEEVWEDQNLGRQRVLNLHARYAELKADINAGEPSIVGIWAHSDVGGIIGHSMVAYKIEEYPGNVSRVFVYDPNYYYDGTDSYLQYLTLDIDSNTIYYSGNIGGSVYSDFEEFMVIEPQLSHSDQFWQVWWWLPWLAVVIGIIACVLLSVFLIRRWQESEYRKEQALEGLNEELDDVHELDTEVYYTEEEINQKVSSEDTVPPGMVMCPNCQTLNPDSNKQCRICAEDL